MAYKAAIFDLDGTLLNTIEDIADACNIVLADEGFPTHTVIEYKGFVGNGIRHLLKAALPMDSLTGEAIEVLLEKLELEFSKHLTIKTRPYPGIVKLLTELEVRGVKISILSNKPHDMVKTAVQTLLGQFKFKVVMGTSEKFPHKPYPQSTLYVIEQMGELLDKTVFIGDSEVDVRTAKNAGIDVIGVGWGFRKVEVLALEGAGTIVQKTEELLRYF